MAKKAKANNTTGTVRKRRRAARNRKRVECRLELSERRVIPRSELTPEEHELGKAMMEEIIEGLNRADPRAEAAAVLDRAAAERIYGRPARRDRLVSTADAATPATVAPSPSAPTSPAKRINSKVWVVERLWRLHKADKIPDKILKTALAQMVVELIAAAQAAGVPIRTLTRDYVRSHLEEWIGCWPIPRNWTKPGDKF
jgi:hypothetical protein